jgi:hypothetical protein
MHAIARGPSAVTRAGVPGRIRSSAAPGPAAARWCGSPPPRGTSSQAPMSWPRNRSGRKVQGSPQRVLVVVVAPQVEQDHGEPRDAVAVPGQGFHGAAADEGGERVEPAQLVGEGFGVGDVAGARLLAVLGPAVQGVAGVGDEPRDGDRGADDVEQLDRGEPGFSCPPPGSRWWATMSEADFAGAVASPERTRVTRSPSQASRRWRVARVPAGPARGRAPRRRRNGPAARAATCTPRPGRAGFRPREPEVVAWCRVPAPAAAGQPVHLS